MARAVGGLLAALLLHLQAPGSAGAAPTEEPQFETVVRASGSDRLPSERAGSSVSQADLARRQPRSAPDALRFEPGIFVQQTAHSQGSAFIRGLTGQQTLLLFDGIRINNSTFRQGPNQYFFTVDSRSIEGIEILRGGGSTRFGSDALGGVIQALPIAPQLPEEPRGFLINPAASGRMTTADSELGGRAEVNIGVRRGPGIAVGFYGGVGGRTVGQLQSAGPVENPNPNTPIGLYPQVPRYARDARTQLGTGFNELTADGRLVIAIGEKHRITLASYHYLQFDAPRTDQCPAPTAPIGTCLTYEQQFRHLTYAAWDAQLGAAAERLRVTVSFQQQHERQRYDDPSILVRRLGVDDANTVGLTVAARTRYLGLGRGASLQLRYGLDGYFDWLHSSAFRTYTDTEVTTQQSRGQYLDGSWFLTSGAYVDSELRLPRRVQLRAGARVSYIRTSASADPISGSRAFDLQWAPVVGNVGIEYRPVSMLMLRFNVDHSFRAPNLNDLTARQQTGPGFQFENPDLGPERATTFELGVVLNHRIVSFQVWGFETLLSDAVLKVSKLSSECPPETPQCEASWTRFQLQNAPELAELRGVESGLRIKLPIGFSARASLAYTWGEGPRVGTLAKGVYGVQLGERVPLTRIPPVNGTVEVAWTHEVGELSAALRWAGMQDRLAIADYSDGRIPKYGTPGFAVLDLRASVRLERSVAVVAVLENVFDSPYRYHGSSINGPGRGIILSAKVQR